MAKLGQEPRLSGRLGARRARGMRVSSSMAEINVVPLVDVMLVLLVIFMVAAPMMQQGFSVRLPQVRKAPSVNMEPVAVIIPSTVTKDGRVKINKEWVLLSDLTVRIQQELDGRASKDVTIAADGAVTMQTVSEVFTQLMAAGVDKIGFLTQTGSQER